ncbi:MAG: hypothetical protein Kow0056_17200 [Coriobacteriia bacterium]
MAVSRSTRRKNAAALPWVRALVFALVVLFALGRMPFYPEVVVPAIAVAAAALALFVPAVAVLLVVVALSLPLAAANIGIGLAFLLVGLAASQYLGQDDARAFIVIGLAFAGAFYNVGWAAIVAAAVTFGASEGAVLALLAALAIEGAGLLAGRDAIGIVATGGVAPGIVDFSGLSPGTVVVAGKEYAALGFKWLGPAFSALDIPALLSSFSGVRQVALLIAQPIIWAVASAVAGGLVKPPGDKRRLPMMFAGAAVGCAGLAGATIAGMAAVSGPAQPARVATAAVVSFALVAVYIFFSEFIFKPEMMTLRTGVTSLHAEDADVDELLRVISTAEDTLATKHTIQAAVLITDMKSFSALTEEEGSVLTAKTIQRHRDLLLPIMARHGGAGKSTGGDGLLAAFERPGDAVAAAVEMQQALERNNEAHPNERPISIRVGIAYGEVVVDKHGRPFIGDALNKAARIMDLADGGQIFAASDVLDMTPSAPPQADHGTHRVKNIGEPIRVIEVLWRPGQEPRPPSQRASEAPGAASDDGVDDTGDASTTTE